MFSIQRALIVSFAIFFLAGCASRPWTEPLGGKEADSVTQLIDVLADRNATCSGTLESDIDLFYETPLEKKAFSGFLQYSMPSSYKFVMTNPFGQPVLVVAGDQESFQAINTLQRNYLSGSIRSFGLRSNIPGYFLKSSWGPLLTGRNQLSSEAITKIRSDRDSRGIWLTFQNENGRGVQHLLLDDDQEIFLVRVLENENGLTVAEITYANWETLGQCKQPKEINITGLDYGTEIRIKLSNILVSDEKKTYRLQIPAGYAQHHMP